MDKITRHEERTWALQILYGLDLKDELNIKNAKNEIIKLKYNNELYPDENYYFEKLIKGVIKSRKSIDEKINARAINWKLERMAYIDRNILRIALYEIETDLPVGVAINEAVELGKEFGDENSPKFINGILGKCT